jgi:hypothetical protein
MTQQTYSGGCHCGAVRFEVQADLDQTTVCNCSICSKRAFIWTFTPAANFRLVEGEERLSRYQFYKKRIDHRFCERCGVEAFAFSAPDAKQTAMVNVRCLDDVDVQALHPTLFDGRSS